MVSMIRSLFGHQAWADAGILKAVGAHAEAREDEKLRSTLHHIVVVQRAFLSLFLGRPFDMDKELEAPQSLDALEQLFHDSHAEERAFIATLKDADLTR